MSKSADAFRTISEVADWLGVPAHVLRFWESKFAQVTPVKRAGGRRYYRPEDMQLLGGIRKLLHDDGMTIKGVQKIIREQGVRHVAELSQALNTEHEDAPEDTAAEIALDVPEQIDEPRGQVVRFQRREAEPHAAAQSGTEAETELEAEANDTEPAETDDLTEAVAEAAPQAEPASEAPDTLPSIEEAAAAETPDGMEEQPAPPAAPAEHTPELAEAAQDSEDFTDIRAARPGIPAIALPDDPPDDSPAPASTLSRLIGFTPRLATAERDQLADIAGRLAALRDSARAYGKYR